MVYILKRKLNSNPYRITSSRLNIKLLLLITLLLRNITLINIKRNIKLSRLTIRKQIKIKLLAWYIFLKEN